MLKSILVEQKLINSKHLNIVRYPLIKMSVRKNIFVGVIFFSTIIYIKLVVIIINLEKILNFNGTVPLLIKV